VAICILAGALRFYALGHQSFSGDEGVTLDLLRRPFGDMLSTVARTESTPPLYYVVAWAWTRIFGREEVGLRSLSALCGTAAVPALYAAARELVSRRAALVTALLAAVSPLLVWYSQEGRSYGLLTLLVALSLFLCFRRSLVGWAVVSALAIATHYYGGFLVAAEAAWLLWSAPARRRAAAAVGGVAVAAAALLPLALEQRSNQNFSDFVAGIDLGQRLKEVPKKFLVGEQGTPGDYGPFVEKLLPVAAVLAAAAVVLLLVRGGARERRGAGVAAGLAAGSAGVPLLLSLAGADVFAAYLLIPAWLPAAIVVGAGLSAGRAGHVAAGALAAVLCAVSVYVAVDPLLERPDARGAADLLGVPEYPRAVVFSPANALHPARAYSYGFCGFPRSGVARVNAIHLVGLASRDESTRNRFGPGAERLRPPPGFRVGARVVEDGFTIVRLESPVPRHVRLAELARLRLGTDAAAQLQVLPRLPSKGGSRRACRAARGA
jgi:mannosyltransferase